MSKRDSPQRFTSLTLFLSHFPGKENQTRMEVRVQVQMPVLLYCFVLVNRKGVG
jgi:hypothetical protein